MGSAVSSKKSIKTSDDLLKNGGKPKNLRPVSGVSEISETDSGYRSPEMKSEGNRINKILSQRDISIHDSHLLENSSYSQGYPGNDKWSKDVHAHNIPYQRCFSGRQSEENVFFLDGIDNEIGATSFFDEDDLKKDSLRNIFMPGAVFNYDKIIHDGKADDLVARIEEEKKRNVKRVKRPPTAISTDIEIDLEKGTEKVRNRLPSFSKKKSEQNTRDPKIRPRAAHGQRRKTVSDVSDDSIDHIGKERKFKDRNSTFVERQKELNLMDALKMLIEQGDVDSKSSSDKKAYKINVSVDLNSDTLTIVLPGSYLFRSK